MQNMLARLLLCSLSSLAWVSGEKENLTAKAGEEAILLSGGGGALRSVEVFSPSTGRTCSLPSLPINYGRVSHTLDSLLLCGGDQDDMPYHSTCLTFSSGKWTRTHKTADSRYGHTSWQTEEGLVLMGGTTYPTTSEIVQMGGDNGKPSFPMQYSTMGACSMADLTSPTVIITGGYDTMQTVSRYNILGWVEDLPSLLVGRSSHGCGSYWREADRTQVFLVAGGVDSIGSVLSSTEVLTTTSPTWVLTTPLPRAMAGLKCVTTGGKPYCTGGWDGDYSDGHYNYRDEVLAWLDEDQQWVEEGKIKTARGFHAVTTINYEAIATFCG